MKSLLKGPPSMLGLLDDSKKFELFDADFRGGAPVYDKGRSKTPLVCDRGNAQPDGKGGTVAIDTPVTDSQYGLRTNGGYTQLVGYSEDTDNWTGSGPWTQTINLSSIGVYTLSTDLSGATVSVAAGTATLDGPASATYGSPDQFEVTGIGTIILTTDTANPKAQVTKTAYRMPYVKSSTASPVTVGNNYSYDDAGTQKGPHWPLKEDGQVIPAMQSMWDVLDGKASQNPLLNSGNLEAAKRYEIITTEADYFGAGVVAGDRVSGLTTALDANNTVREVSPAQGKIGNPVGWTPGFSADDVPNNTNINLFTPSNTDITGLYARKNNLGTKEFSARALTNLATISGFNWQADTTYPWRIVFDTDQMQLQVYDPDTETWLASAITTFPGTWNPGDYLSFGYDNICPQHQGKLIVSEHVTDADWKEPT